MNEMIRSFTSYNVPVRVADADSAGTVPRRVSSAAESPLEERQRADNQELKDDEVQGDENRGVSAGESVSDIEQGSEDS